MAAAGAAMAVAVGAGTVGYLQLAGDEGCTGDPVRLTVVSSPDQFPVLNRLADQWTATRPDVDGRCVAATVRSMPASAVAATIGPGWDERRDGPRPDVWAPDFSAWLTLAAARQDAATVLPTAAPQSLASSPTVIAMQRPMAEALGWPREELGWSGLLGAFSGGKTWAQYGHPEWGPLQIGMVDPTKSGAGLVAALTILDPNNDQTMSNEELFGGLSLSQLTTINAADPAELMRRFSETGGNNPLPAAFPVLERELAQYAANKPRVPLVPVYPREGIGYADYPYAILRAEWVDDTRRRAAADLLTFLQSSDGRRAYQAAGFRDPGHAVGGATLLATDHGFRASLTAPSRGLTAEGLTQLLGTWTVLQRPNNALLLLDTSGSMNDSVPGTNQSRLQLIQRAAIAGSGLLNNQTTVGLWTFSIDQTPTTDYRELVPPGLASEAVGGVPRRQAIAGAVQGLKAGGGTGLYDTIYAAYLRMQQAWQPNAQNVLVVMTDGKNEDENGLSLAQLTAQLKRAARADRPLPVIGIACGPQADANALGEVSKVTGGRTFVARDDVSAVQQIVLAFAGRIG
ncbi:VWA domain-containing protein [Phytohabitans aurantiacus]|uniref:VWA domain-containing protein n=2 Tax=Phytohabitans aurantiacus TaxID=3016789 RepID=A0ABQ5QTP6_9ACTN|nr:VWA domain-containing protein [Phytohabitans aurantiacus]